MPRGSLWEVLRSRDSALSDGMRHQMALDIARGMSYLHSLQPPILHRDLKALNLLVDKSFNVKVADFGIARPRVDDTMTFCGTPKWTAPEVLRMNNYSEKADVFSFGVVCVGYGLLARDGGGNVCVRRLWEMMTAEEPYQDMPLMQVQPCPSHPPPPPPPPAPAPPPPPPPAPAPAPAVVDSTAGCRQRCSRRHAPPHPRPPCLHPLHRAHA